MDKIREWELIEQIGEPGGMGVVYKAKHQNLERITAIKKLHYHLAQSETIIRRFEDEAATLSRLEHDNIVKVHDFFREGDNYYLIMEFVEGQSLSEYLQTSSISEDNVLKYMDQILSAISYAHDKQILHRDIKPSNILITTQNLIKVVDFGIAKIMGKKGLTSTGLTVGSPWYMSPEQITGKELDERSDIYSLGITMFEMFTGHVPFEDTTEYKIYEKHQKEKVPSLKTYDQKFSSELDNIIDKATAKSSDQRYQNANEFSDAIKGYLIGKEFEDSDISSALDVAVTDDTKIKEEETVDWPEDFDLDDLTTNLDTEPTPEMQTPPAKDTLVEIQSTKAGETLFQETAAEQNVQKTQVPESKSNTFEPPPPSEPPWWKDKKYWIAASAGVLIILLIWIFPCGPYEFDVWEDNISFNTVTLKWDVIDDAEQFEVFRKEISATEYSYMSSTSSEQYEDNTLRPNTNYDYIVKAVDMDNDLIAEGKYSIKTTSITLGFLVTEITKSKVNLEWKEIDGVTEYLVLREDADGKTKQIYRGIATKYIDKYLKTNREYIYTLQITFTDQTEFKSQPLYVTTDPSLPPPPPPQDILPPKTFTIRETSDKYAQLSWNYQNSRIDQVVIERRIEPRYRFSKINKLDANNTNYIDNTIEEGSKYEYRLYSIYNDKKSKYSNRRSFSVTKESVIEEHAIKETVVEKIYPPTNFSISKTDKNLALLSWDYTKSSNEKIIIERKLQSESQFKKLDEISSKSKSYKDNSVLPGNVYEYQLFAKANGKISKPSETRSIVLTSVDISPDKLLDSGIKYFTEGNLVTASQYLLKIRKPETIIEQRKDYLKARKYLGLIEHKNQKYSDAVKYFNECLEIESNKADTYFYLGNSYSALGSYNMALKNFEKVYVYQTSLTGNSGWETLFETDYIAVSCYYKIWQKELDANRKNTSADECLDKTSQFLEKYENAGNSNKYKQIRELSTKYANVNLWRQNILNN